MQPTNQPSRPKKITYRRRCVTHPDGKKETRKGPINNTTPHHTTLTRVGFSCLVQRIQKDTSHLFDDRRSDRTRTSKTCANNRRRRHVSGVTNGKRHPHHERKWYRRASGARSTKHVVWGLSVRTIQRHHRSLSLWHPLRLRHRRLEIGNERLHDLQRQTLTPTQINQSSAPRRHTGPAGKRK